MNRLIFALVWIAIVGVVLAAMWWGWRRRTQRDAGVHGVAVLAGEVLATFTDVQYVSTTPVGEPLVRVAAPGLRYRGFAEITVRRDGVTVQVRGELPVHLHADDIVGSATVSRRIGKAVERDGLALLVWRSDDRELESSFRFAQRADQSSFGALVAEIAWADSGAAGTAPGDTERAEASQVPTPASSSSSDAQTHNTTQEDA